MRNLIRNIRVTGLAGALVTTNALAGEIPGPRMAVSGPGLGITGGIATTTR